MSKRIRCTRVTYIWMILGWPRGECPHIRGFANSEKEADRMTEDIKTEAYQAGVPKFYTRKDKALVNHIWAAGFKLAPLRGPFA